MGRGRYTQGGFNMPHSFSKLSGYFSGKVLTEKVTWDETEQARCGQQVAEAAAARSVADLFGEVPASKAEFVALRDVVKPTPRPVRLVEEAQGPKVLAELRSAKNAAKWERRMARRAQEAVAELEGLL